MTRDLTQGSPFKSIISFALPIMLGNLFQQAYNMADTAIVGKFVGVEALAGVGATGSVNFLIIGFVMGMSTGFSIPVAQCFGSKDYDTLRKYYTNSMWLSAVVAVALTILTLIFIEPLLVLMQTPQDMFPYAKLYITTIFAGIPGIFLYNLLASMLRSLGDSKTPVMFLIGAALLNVILDLIFVLIFNMGVLGTGLATIISQTTAGILCLVLINKKFPLLVPNKEDWKIRPDLMKKLVSMGIPMGLQFSITAIGAVVLQSFTNTLGSAACAAVTSGSKISMLSHVGIDAIGAAMATFAGQNLGAGKLERVAQGAKQSIIVGVIYSVIIFGVLQVVTPYVSLVFVSADEVEIIQKICFYITINSSTFIFLTVLLVLRNVIQGVGYSVLAMIAGGTEMLARIFVGVVLIPNFGFTGAAMSNATAWVCAVIFLVPAYIYVMKKVKSSIIKER